MKSTQLARLKKLEQVRANQPRVTLLLGVLDDPRHGCTRVWLSDGTELRGAAAERAIAEDRRRNRQGDGEGGVRLIGGVDVDKCLGLVLEEDGPETERERGFHGLLVNPTQDDQDEGEEPAEDHHEPEPDDADDDPPGDDPPDPAPPAPPPTPVEDGSPQGEGFDAERFFGDPWEAQKPRWRQQQQS